MSHDLRSPLAGIRGMADALADGVVREPDEVADYLGRIRRETEPDGRDGRGPVPAVPGHLGHRCSCDLEPLALGEVVLRRGGRRGRGGRGGRRRGGGRRSRAVADGAGQRHRADPGGAQPARPTRCGTPRPAGRCGCPPAPGRGRRWLRVAGRLRRHPGRRTSPRIFDVGFRGSGARTPAEHVRGRARAWPSPAPCRGARRRGSPVERRPGLPLRDHPAAAAPARAATGSDAVSSTKLRRAPVAVGAAQARAAPPSRHSASAPAQRPRDRRPVPARGAHPGGAAPEHLGRGSVSTSTVPPAAEQPRRPAQQPQRVAADPDVAVGEQHVVPAALAGQRAEHVAAHHRRPPAPAVLAARRRRGRRPAPAARGAANAATSRPGPQPRSTPGRCSGRAASASSASARLAPAPHGQVELGRRRCPAGSRGAGQRGVERGGHRAAPSRAVVMRRRPRAATASRTGSPGQPRATARASASVSTSVSSGSSATRSPAARSAAQRARAGVGARGRHVGDQLGVARVAQASAHQPPSAAGPSSASGPSAVAHRVEASAEHGRLDLRGVHAQLQHGARAGQRARATSAWAAAIRSPELAAALGDDRRPAQRGGQLPARPLGPSPASATTTCAAGTRRAPPPACRAARRRPGRRPARGVAGGHSRVLTRPGSGALASTISTRSTPRSSAGRRFDGSASRLTDP